MTPAEQAAKDRDGANCLRCGMDLWGQQASKHHRKKRRFPDADRVENIVILCGTGTTGCHGWCHSHDREARATGWVVSSWDKPAERPLITLDQRMIMLTEDGGKVINQLPTNYEEAPF